MRVSKLFVSYEKIADTLLKSDLEEIARMRKPDLPTRTAVFAYGVMLGLVDREVFSENKYVIFERTEMFMFVFRGLFMLMFMLIFVSMFRGLLLFYVVHISVVH